jgi:osmoprotectant transport system ATP-binding protein
MTNEHANPIEFRDVTYQIAGVTLPLVSGLNFEVAHGKTVVLLGESGSGKTTTLRLINRLLVPSSGEVRIEGRVTTSWNAEELRQRCGYVIQEGGLFPHLTAEQNVLLLGRHLQRPAGELQTRLQELCALTQMTPESLQRFPSELSGGQRQRVSLMRALLLDPSLLLLDEPLGALDPMVRAALQDDLKSIFARLQKTVVLVTHDLAEAAYLGDWIVLFRNGRIVQQGTLDDLREQPAERFVTEFISAQRRMVAL